jgi:hypothetical protein
LPHKRHTGSSDKAGCSLRKLSAQLKNPKMIFGYELLTFFHLDYCHRLWNFTRSAPP